MSFLPLWMIRIAITLLVIWLIWACLLGPWLFSTHAVIYSHYEWMLP